MILKYLKMNETNMGYWISLLCEKQWILRLELFYTGLHEKAVYQTLWMNWVYIVIDRL